MLEAGGSTAPVEWQIFQRLIVPTIWPTIVTVATTIAILTLKIYDIVTAMTNGNFSTQVIATMSGSRRSRSSTTAGERPSRSSCWSG